MAPRWIAPIVTWLARPSRRTSPVVCSRPAAGASASPTGGTSGPTVDAIDDPAVLGDVVRDSRARPSATATCNGRPATGPGPSERPVEENNHGTSTTTPSEPRANPAGPPGTADRACSTPSASGPGPKTPLARARVHHREHPGRDPEGVADLLRGQRLHLQGWQVRHVGPRFL